MRSRQRTQAQEYEQDKKPEQDRGEDLAEVVDDFTGIPAQIERDAEENKAEDDRRGQGLRADERCDGSRERHSSRTREGVEGADRQVDHDGKDDAERLAGAAHEVAQVGARQGDRNDGDDGQCHAADQETDHRGSEVGTRGRAHDRWENQVTCAKKHREKRQGGCDEDGGAARASSGIVIDCLRHCYSLDGVGSITAPILARRPRKATIGGLPCGCEHDSELRGLHGHPHSSD